MWLCDSLYVRKLLEKCVILPAVRGMKQPLTERCVSGERKDFFSSTVTVFEQKQAGMTYVCSAAAG